MAPLGEVRKSTAAVVRSQPIVLVIFGSTSTIARNTLRTLAELSSRDGKGFRAYLVGRNAAATENVISECRDIYAQGQYKFIKASDLSLIQDIGSACEEIIKIEEETQDPRIDYLLLCQGGPIFIPRKDTTEGIDGTMSLMYYSRMKAVMELLPLLLKSTLPATVVSVYAAGLEGKLYPDDLSLRNLSKYSYVQARSHIVYMHTLFMEALSEKHPESLRLIHAFPGLVVGPGFQNPEIPAWLRILTNWVVLPIFGRWITTPPDECGTRILSLASSRYPPRPVDWSRKLPDVVPGTDGREGSGAYAIRANGEGIVNTAAYSKFNKDEMKMKVWKHTCDALEIAGSGKVFTE
ncbi:hypothetical protein JX265_000807 [Neoarthrinium moseri]|uniref:Uncharacterized protein n=1 Tax=Neoarthrinium moseri TaxID=1658444 RepID=A0A9Q0ARC9_9PEZI|nr:uncharacterized protein JN550_007087 [Neoarthrinium moseri]KAI1847556.1 hypothetical protein JX266_006408 [Neoarthrinium moseri]KAI1867356.1 hypothetical protein JN550_007087 [Neoarthrinium moseri]KAI1880567.1 hypothetical protein JX265_000807 [Neoarthrinium moseri]